MLTVILGHLAGSPAALAQQAARLHVLGRFAQQLGRVPVLPLLEQRLVAGFVVPVVRDVASLSLEQAGASLDALTTKARDGKLDLKDVSGGSFTISNHGVSGSLLASPIILHQGQAAILGVGKLDQTLQIAM